MNEPDEGAPFLPSPERIARISKRMKAKGLREKRLASSDTSYVKSPSMRIIQTTKVYRACGKQELD